MCAGSCRRPLPLTCHLAPAGSPGGAQSSSTNPSSRWLSVRIQLPLPCHAGTPRAAPLMNPVGISSGPGENSTDYVLVSLVGSVLESWGQKDLKGTWPHPAICVDPLSPEAPWGLDSFPHPGSGGFISASKDPLSPREEEKCGVMERPVCRSREDRDRSLHLPHHPVGSRPWCPDLLLQHEE